VATVLPRPLCFGPDEHPVLDSVLPAAAAAESVETDLDAIRSVASWMAYEELPEPAYLLPFRFDSREQLIDFVLVSALLNFAFTDFDTGTRFDVSYEGRVYADADALFACLHRALVEGTDVLDGAVLAGLDAGDLRRIFRDGTIEIPLLEERVRILNEAGATLVERWDGHFHHLVDAASERLWDDGRGLIDLLLRDFPRWRDVVELDGRTVRLYKLAQLAVWMLHATLRDHGGLRVVDLHRLTAFADYIVPAALEVLGILRYSEPLRETILGRRELEQGGRWEVEIRAHTIVASALLCDAVNELRPPELQVIAPRIDARLWVPFHATHRPHHLVRTVMY